MSKYNPPLTNAERGQTVYGRHPRTGEKQWAERYRVVGRTHSGIDGLVLTLVDLATGHTVES